MSAVFTFILVVLCLLALAGLFVGVSNDAVNFLNSALGSKAAPVKVILLVASVGIIIGAVTSSGMMEIARSGMFDPSLFTFREIMLLYLGVMVANVILLDLYNSLGLPTSTTVSLIFCLLGSAIAVSTYKIAQNPELTMSAMGDFIKTGRAMGIVSAILLSVVFAFSCGTIIMSLSRFIFTFRYKKIFSRWGAMWCGLSFTAIIYFALFKGLKGLLGATLVGYMNDHLVLTLAVIWVVASAVMFMLQKLNVNILKVNILAGTFSLALAFAGNDLVNFIGVPVAGFDSYRMASASGDIHMTMAALQANVPTNFVILIAAGLFMIVTLWTSKRAFKISQTELKLSSQGSEEERYGSSLFARTLVRAVMNMNAGYERVVPRRIQAAIAKRFEPLTDEERGNVSYDLIRATVNLTTSSLLISIATLYKLPLSTTYVCFMVAMGTSFADRAWGRESAVYRITGVLTVIAGWFVTGFGAFVIAYLVALALMYGGTVTMVAVVALCGWMLIKNIFFKKNKEEEVAAPVREEASDKIISSLVDEVCDVMEKVTRIYDRTLLAVFKENRKVLRDMVKESNDLFYLSRERKYSVLSTLQKLHDSDIDTGHYYVQVVDYISEVAKALVHITRPCFDHIDNNHEGFSKEQVMDLMQVNDAVGNIYERINVMLKTNDFRDLNLVLELRDQLFETIAAAIKNQLKRINSKETGTKSSLLYLTILNETKTMVLQSRNLLKSQSYFLEAGEHDK